MLERSLWNLWKAQRALNNLESVECMDVPGSSIHPFWIPGTNMTWTVQKGRWLPPKNIAGRRWYQDEAGQAPHDAEVLNEFSFEEIGLFP